MSKTEFRLMIDSEIKERFKAACSSLNPTPAMTSEISEFMRIYAEYVEKTGKRPHITSISNEYEYDTDITSDSHGYDMSNYVSKKDYLDLTKRIEALENKTEVDSPTEKVTQPIEEMSGNDRLTITEKKSNASIDNNSESHHNIYSETHYNQTAQSNSKNGQINSEQLSFTFPVETEKQENNKTNEPVEIENNLKNPNSHLATSNAGEDNTSDAEKSVDKQVNTLLAKYPGLGLHQALAKNRIGEYKKIPEEVKRAHCKVIEPTSETRLTQTEIGYRLDYAHGRNLGRVLSSGKFEYLCKDKDPHKFIWELDDNSVTGDISKYKYFKVSNKILDIEDRGSDPPTKKKEVSLPETVIPGETKLRPDHLRLRLTQHWEFLGNKPISRGGLQNNRRSIAAQNDPKHHQNWIKERDPDNIAWDYIEEEKKYIAIE